SVHHIWCPLSSQEYQDLPDGAETTLTFLVTVAKNLDGKTSQALQAKMDDFNRRLNDIEQRALKRILSEFEALGELTTAAFNVENNRQLLEASITLAQAYGVDKNKIIKNADDLDAFMMA
ncbi:hypothetical protein RVP30_28615, partial [Klebsiella grimontii]|nr:hypothetical protein [Klebsiella grimontii]MDV0380573.1 hypothetical protein [Klebsiella grimontii]MDV0391209.1 hypothetical protein [Klebsiella grimontii]MDV0412143.1 hypothetical protein [Klebsiella grimontii]MDV0423303.1 hypothetical protein [Klebsiella grimontii]